MPHSSLPSTSKLPKPTPKETVSRNAEDSDSDASGSEDDHGDMGRSKIAKRANKHAPMEVTSKKPVTRRRTVVETKTFQARDPRFMPLAGEFSQDKFREQYSFLADNHVSEMRTLRDNLKRARKRLSSAPRDLRAEYEEEVGRLELALKRAESSVNRDKREKAEHGALTKVSEEEREKRKQGKGGWWMKESAKKELVVRARYDALAAEGGKRAVKKAIEKKQRKIGQKEKKSRPFAAEDGRPRKRPKMQ